MDHKHKKSVESVDQLRKTPSINIPVQEVAALFQCARCQVAPIKPPVYTCRNSHSTCSPCYHRSNRDCSVCKEPLMGRNQVLEEVVNSLPSQTWTALTEYRNPLKESRSEHSLHLIVQDPSHLEMLEKARLQAEMCEGSGDYSPEQYVTGKKWCFRPSHRPVACPYPCAQLVTYSGLYPHFELYHPHVFITIVHKETCSLTEIYHDDVVRSESRCHNFFVIRLIDGLADDNCTWTSAELQQMTRAVQESFRPKCFMATLTVGRLSDTVPTKEVGDSWGIAIWAACLFEYSPVTYTLSVTSNASIHSASFTGPLVSLHQSQRPRDVYSQSGCLFLSSGMLRQLRFDQTPLKVAVTFHSEIPVGVNEVDVIEIPPIEKNLYNY